MGIKALRANLDGLDEAAASLYREGTDEEGLKGKFILDVDGVDGYAIGNIGNLKNALESERERAAKHEKRAKAFGDLDPEDVTQKLTKLEEMSAIDPAKEADKLADEKVKAARAQIEAEFTKKLEVEQAARKASAQQVRDLSVNGALQSAITAAGLEGNRAAVLTRYALGFVKYEDGEDGSGHVRVLNDNGETRYGPKGDPMTVPEYVKATLDDPEFEWLAPPRNPDQGGSGAQPTQTPQRGTRKIAAQDMNNNIEALANGEVELIR